jgi:hypothetical protein
VGTSECYPGDDELHAALRRSSELALVSGGAGAGLSVQQPLLKRSGDSLPKHRRTRTTQFVERVRPAGDSQE